MRLAGEDMEGYFSISVVKLLLRPAFGRNRYLLSRRRIRNQTKKLQRRGARVPKLMDFIGLHKDNIPRLESMRLIFLIDNALPFQNKNFVLIRMAMPRRMTAGIDFKLPHRKIRRAISLA